MIKKFHENGQCPLDTYSHSQPNINCKLAKRSKNINDYLTPIIYTDNNIHQKFYTADLMVPAFKIYTNRYVFWNVFCNDLYDSTVLVISERIVSKEAGKITGQNRKFRFGMQISARTAENYSF